MNSIHFNIKLNINTLKTIFKYFNMDENNTIIELNTKREKVRENIKEYKDNILKITNESIYLKKLAFGKLYYFLTKNFISHIIFYKTNSVSKINDCEAKIEIKGAKIYKISFSNKYDLGKTKETFKKYKSIDIEYIVLFLLLIGGIIIFILRK